MSPYEKIHFSRVCCCAVVQLRRAKCFQRRVLQFQQFIQLQLIQFQLIE
jgi:hypothetical protein